MAHPAYYEWDRAGRPNSGWIRPQRMVYGKLRAYGYTVYGIGNNDHLWASTPEDHCPFSVTGWPGPHPRWWLTGGDVMPPKAGSGLPTLQQIGAQMLADKKTGHPGMAWLKYMNWEPERNNGGPCYQERFMPSYVRRNSSDRGHIHQSARSDMVHYTGADNYDPVARVRGQGGGGIEMPTADEIIQAWSQGVASIGSFRVVPVEWQVASENWQMQREQWQKAVSADLMALKNRPAGVVELRPEDRAAIVADVVAGVLAALPPFPTVDQVANEIHQRMAE